MEYKFKKYNHSARFGFGLAIFKRRMFKKFKFDKSCEYDLRSMDQFDINKLFGWSQGSHHKNSCRLGWVWNLDSLRMEIYAYCYVNGVRKDIYLCDTELDKWYEGQIWIQDDIYCFRIIEAGDIIGYCEIPYGFSCNLGYTLHPYFGGNQPAPKDMTLHLDNI